jgi:hypothetical protein
LANGFADEILKESSVVTGVFITLWDRLSVVKQGQIEIVEASLTVRALVGIGFQLFEWLLL